MFWSIYILNHITKGPRAAYIQEYVYFKSYRYPIPRTTYYLELCTF